MGSRGNCGTCDAVILRLEWPSGMDDQVRTNFLNSRLDVSVDVQGTAGRGINRRQRSSKGIRLGLRSPGNQECDVGIAGQRFGDIASEIPVATNDQDTLHQLGLATISQKTTTNPVKAGQPRTNQAFLSRS